MKLIIECINPNGAILLTYSLKKCFDDCCYKRECIGDEQYWFGEKAEVITSFHTRSGISFDNFLIDKRDWKILEIPEGYTITEDNYGYTLNN